MYVQQAAQVDREGQGGAVFCHKPEIPYMELQDLYFSCWVIILFPSDQTHLSLIFAKSALFYALLNTGCLKIVGFFLRGKMFPKKHISNIILTE